MVSPSGWAWKEKLVSWHPTRWAWEKKRVVPPSGWAWKEKLVSWRPTYWAWEKKKSGATQWLGVERKVSVVAPNALGATNNIYTSGSVWARPAAMAGNEKPMATVSGRVTGNIMTCPPRKTREKISEIIVFFIFSSA